MRTPRQPLFLARQSYRRRRLVDATRLLPVLGGGLMLLPLLWQGGAAPVRTSVVGLYLFAVWFALIAATALLGRWLAPEPDGGREGTGRDRPKPDVAPREGSG